MTETPYDNFNKNRGNELKKAIGFLLLVLVGLSALFGCEASTKTNSEGPVSASSSGESISKETGFSSESSSYYAPLFFDSLEEFKAYLQEENNTPYSVQGGFGNMLAETNGVVFVPQSDIIEEELNYIEVTDSMVIYNYQIASSDETLTKNGLQTDEDNSGNDSVTSTPDDAANSKQDEINRFNSYEEYLQNNLEYADTSRFTSQMNIAWHSNGGKDSLEEFISRAPDLFKEFEEYPGCYFMETISPVDEQICGYMIYLD